MLFLVLFPTSLCGVFVFGCALSSVPPPPAAPLTHNLLLTTHSHTQLSHTHNLLTHTTLSHTTLTHNSLRHNSLTHNLLTHNLLTHNLLTQLTHTHTHPHNSLTHNRSDATQSAILRGRSGTRWQRCCLLISYAIWHLVALSSSMQARACLLFLDLLQTWSDGWLV